MVNARRQVLGLRPRFAVLAQREAAERSGGGGEGGHEGDDDLETAKGVARLFAEIGEAYTALIATGARPCTAALKQQAAHAACFSSAWM